MLHPSPNLIKNGCFLGLTEERGEEEDKKDMEERRREEKEGGESTKDERS